VLNLLHALPLDVPLHVRLLLPNMLLLPRVLPRVPLGMEGVRWKTIQRNTLLASDVLEVLEVLVFVPSAQRLLGAGVPAVPCHLLQPGSVER
jgi:hypothetical protein